MDLACLVKPLSMCSLLSSRKEDEVKRLQALVDSSQAAQAEKQQPTQPDSAEYLQRILSLQQRMYVSG